MGLEPAIFDSPSRQLQPLHQDPSVELCEGHACPTNKMHLQILDSLQANRKRDIMTTSNIKNKEVCFIIEMDWR